jgi:hypothetical protein
MLKGHSATALIVASLLASLLLSTNADAQPLAGTRGKIHRVAKTTGAAMLPAQDDGPVAAAIQRAAIRIAPYASGVPAGRYSFSVRPAARRGLLKGATHSAPRGVLLVAATGF